MSAFDIAGAVVWTGLAAYSLYLRLTVESEMDRAGFGFIALAFCLPALFCIARLFGAHL